MTATIEEGQTQAIALDNSIEKYLLMDTSKVEKQDFYSFYQLEEVTAVVTNKDKFDTSKVLEKVVSDLLKKRCRCTSSFSSPIELLSINNISLLHLFCIPNENQ